MILLQEVHVRCFVLCPRRRHRNKTLLKQALVELKLCNVATTTMTIILLEFSRGPKTSKKVASNIENRANIFKPSILHNQWIIKFLRNAFIMGHSTGNRDTITMPRGTNTKYHWVFQMCLRHHSFSVLFCVSD